MSTSVSTAAASVCFVRPWRGRGRGEVVVGGWKVVVGGGEAVVAEAEVTLRFSG